MGINIDPFAKMPTSPEGKQNLKPRENPQPPRIFARNKKNGRKLMDQPSDYNSDQDSGDSSHQYPNPDIELNNK